MAIGNNPNIGPGEENLELIAGELDESNYKVKKTFSSFLGRVVVRFSFRHDNVPDWAAKHVRLHRKLADAIDKRKADQGEIPKNVYKILYESDGVLQLLSERLTKTEKPRIYGLSNEDLLKAASKELKGAINAAFQKEMKRGNALEHDLNEILNDFGIDVENILPNEFANLVTHFLLKRNGKTSSKAEMSKLMYDFLLSEIVFKNRSAANYHIEASALEKKFLEPFGITESKHGLPDCNIKLRDLLYAQSKVENKNSLLYSELENGIKSILARELIDNYKSICSKIKTKEINTPEDIEKNMIVAMEILYYLTTAIPFTINYKEEWMSLQELFKEIIDIKGVSEIIGNIFEQYQPRIDEGLRKYYHWVNKDQSLEHWTREIYGKTVDEMEAIKKSNRKDAAKEVEAFALKIQQGEPLTVDMLNGLHMANNKGIVPKSASTLRKEEWENVIFFNRVGVVAENVDLAVNDLLKRVNQFITKYKDKKGPLSDLRWAVNVAKFHNELLDIHPFIDRNGSTCLLFTELLMAVRGEYKPPPTRTTMYYNNISNILQSPIAVAIVAYGHIKMAQLRGYYKSAAVPETGYTKHWYKKQLRS